MIICFIGNMGGGKTLSMTNALFKSHKDKHKVISNYTLNFKHDVLSMDLLKSYHTSNKQIENSSFGIDEAHIFLDSRNFMSKSNKIISYFLLQTRKRGIKAYLSFQKYNQIDIRIRQNASFLVDCESYELIGNKLYLLTEGEPIFSQDNVWIKQTWFKSDKDVNWKLHKKVMLKASDLYNKYNTKEIINFNEE